MANRIPASALALSLLLAAAAAAQENIPVSGVTVVAARPTKSDVARLRKALDIPPGRTDKEVEEKHDVYLVKVQAEAEHGPAQLALSIGGREVPGFGAYEGGLFLRVHDPKTLEEWAGREVRVYTKGPNGEVPEADSAAPVRVPAPVSAASGPGRERPSVDEALRRGR
jgi:hypothetical protein